ncbi:MAG: HAMP domain-containing histidine kinase [Pseudodesulfovibrio sp.]|nr:HAMP domain-containing histidine kinase [Pseudodesulfovibrio sp.]
MKINKLYLKIFLAFVVVLIIAETVVFSVVLSGKVPPPVFYETMERIMVVDRLIEREIQGVPSDSASLREKVTPLLELLVKGSPSRIWITDKTGAMVSASFRGEAPTFSGELSAVDLKTPEGVRFFGVRGKNYRSAYVESEIKLEDGTLLKVHFFQGKRPRRAEVWFFKGLFFLTVLGALFLFPVSRMITKPVLQLAESAERLGKGDFSQRVPEKGHDEVTVLARKFNRMAGRLEKMVMSGKGLTAHLSHELRSPLARMRISLQMLMERTGTGDAASSKYLSGMEKEIENMDVLIGRILDLSKMDMVQLPPIESVLDISKYLWSCLDKYGPMIQQGGIHLSTEISDVPSIYGLEHGVNVLLDNLLGNAIKYTDPGGQIRVGLRADDDLRLTIYNTYHPIAKKDLSGMFVPFNRLESNKTQGSGLGLAFAQRIVAHHGGTIVASNEEDGLCITVTLPLRAS